VLIYLTVRKNIFNVLLGSQKVKYFCTPREPMHQIDFAVWDLRCLCFRCILRVGLLQLESNGTVTWITTPVNAFHNTHSAGRQYCTAYSCIFRDCSCIVRSDKCIKIPGLKISVGHGHCPTHSSHCPT
jgi:hypothetical protein